MSDGLYLDRVTVTGADDNTSILGMRALSEQYPFVEWGILASPARVGSERFPSHVWMQALADDMLHRPGVLRTSLHLCGGYVRDLLGRGVNPAVHVPVWRVTSRVQLNFHAEPHTLQTVAFCQALLAYNYREFIFQIDGVNNQVFAEALATPTVKAVPLFDTSGGAGLVPERWPPATFTTSQPWSQSPPAPAARVYHGYAGGLGPGTIAHELPRIEAAAAGARIWIDMEGRVRTAGRFDLEKVAQVLEYCRQRVVKAARGIGAT